MQATMSIHEYVNIHCHYSQEGYNTQYDSITMERHTNREHLSNRFDHTVKYLRFDYEVSCVVQFI